MYLANEPGWNIWLVDVFSFCPILFSSVYPNIVALNFDAPGPVPAAPEPMNCFLFPLSFFIFSFSLSSVSYLLWSLSTCSWISCFWDTMWSLSRPHLALSFSNSKIIVDLLFSISLHFCSTSDILDLRVSRSFSMTLWLSMILRSLSCFKSSISFNSLDSLSINSTIFFSMVPWSDILSLCSNYSLFCNYLFSFSRNLTFSVSSLCILWLFSMVSFSWLLYFCSMLPNNAF